MAKFRITNTTSGLVLGDYEADTALGAYQSSLIDAGYADAVAAASAGFDWHAAPSDIAAQVVVDASDYEDCDDSLGAAANDWIVDNDLDMQPWALAATWDDDNRREYILIDVPRYMLRGKEA